MEWDMVSVSEAKVRLHELVGKSDARPLVVLRHSRPAAVVLSYNRWVGLLREVEDLRDRLALLKSKGSPPDMRLSADKVRAELGLTPEG